MKKAFLVAALMLLMAGAVYAGVPYAGLYAGVYDPDTGIEGAGGSDHSACSVQVAAPYSDIEMWIWFLPDPQKGLAAVEFKITYPTTVYVIQGAVTSNPLNQVELGSLGAGITATVGGMQCQYDWYWSHHQTLTLKKTTSSGYCMIVADPGLVTPPFAVIDASCELGFPAYACTILNNLALNQACIVATQDKSWGAIKSLYGN